MLLLLLSFHFPRRNNQLNSLPWLHQRISLPQDDDGWLLLSTRPNNFYGTTQCVTVWHDPTVSDCLPLTTTCTMLTRRLTTNVMMDDNEKDDDKIVDEMRRAPVISKFSSFSFMFYFHNMYLQAIYMTTTTKWLHGSRLHDRKGWRQDCRWDASSPRYK